jgi:hypothetical protein
MQCGFKAKARRRQGAKEKKAEGSKLKAEMLIFCDSASLRLCVETFAPHCMNTVKKARKKLQNPATNPKSQT